MIQLQSLRGGFNVSIHSKPQKAHQNFSRCATICASHTVTLRMPGGKTASFKADSAHSIYDYAAYAGIKLPACCMEGSCTSCVAKVVKGRVDQHKQCCLNAELTEEGFVALCCAVPLSDVTLETHQGAAARKLRREIQDRECAA